MSESAYGLRENVRLLCRDLVWSMRAKRPGHRHDRILCNSYPKSGTHLLYEVLKESKTHIPWNDIVSWQSLSGRVNSMRHIRDKLAAAPGGAIVRSHLPYDTELRSVISELGYRVVTIVRDPRDVVISHAHWVRKEERFYLSSYYRSLPLREAIMSSITGRRAGSSTPTMFSSSNPAAIAAVRRR